MDIYNLVHTSMDGMVRGFVRIRKMEHDLRKILFIGPILDDRLKEKLLKQSS